MMKRAKHCTMILLDIVDHFVLRHSVHWVCDRIGESSWWSDDPAHFKAFERWYYDYWSKRWGDLED